MDGHPLDGDPQPRTRPADACRGGSRPLRNRQCQRRAAGPGRRGHPRAVSRRQDHRRAHKGPEPEEERARLWPPPNPKKAISFPATISRNSRDYHETGRGQDDARHHGHDGQSQGNAGQDGEDAGGDRCSSKSTAPPAAVSSPCAWTARVAQGHQDRPVAVQGRRCRDPRGPDRRRPQGRQGQGRGHHRRKDQRADRRPADSARLEAAVLRKPRHKPAGSVAAWSRYSSGRKAAPTMRTLRAASGTTLVVPRKSTSPSSATITSAQAERFAFRRRTDASLSGGRLGQDGLVETVHVAGLERYRPAIGSGIGQVGITGTRLHGNHLVGIPIRASHPINLHRRVVTDEHALRGNGLDVTGGVVSGVRRREMIPVRQPDAACLDLCAGVRHSKRRSLCFEQVPGDALVCVRRPMGSRNSARARPPGRRDARSPGRCGRQSRGTRSSIPPRSHISPQRPGWRRSGAAGGRPPG